MRRAIESLELQQPILFDFDLAGRDANVAAPVCGGLMSIMVDPTATAQWAVYAAAAESLQRRKRGCIVSQIKGDPGNLTVYTRFVTAEDEDLDTESHVKRALEQQRPIYLPAEKDSPAAANLLVQPVVPQPQLLVVGAGHVGQATAQLAAETGFDVVVIDDRADFAAQSRFPEQITVRCGSIVEQVGEFAFDADTYVLIVNRNHRLDAEALAACLQHDVAYIGMIGSRRKVELLKHQFIESGKATLEQLDKLYAPVGLDLGAATVPEIAISIVAQLVSVRRTGAAPRFGSGSQRH
jgi:xanthine dehydrogenase accessory factor